MTPVATYASGDGDVLRVPGEGDVPDAVLPDGVETEITEAQAKLVRKVSKDHKVTVGAGSAKGDD